MTSSSSSRIVEAAAAAVVAYRLSGREVGGKSESEVSRGGGRGGRPRSVFQFLPVFVVALVYVRIRERGGGCTEKIRGLVRGKRKVWAPAAAGKGERRGRDKIQQRERESTSL